MPILVTPSEADFLVGRILDNGWYQWRITAVEAVPNKKDANKSNVKITCTAIGGSDARGPVAGVEVFKYFALGDKNGFLTNFGVGIGIPDLAAGVKFDVERWQGHDFDGFCKQGEYEGKPTNNLDLVAPMGKMTNL